MALDQGIVGVQNGADGGTPTTKRMGQQGDTIVSGLHGAYYEQTVRGNVFFGSNGATPSVTTVALATTYTGLALINPANSLVNLSVLKVGYSFLVAFPAAATIGVMVGFNALGTTTFTAAASPGVSSKTITTAGYGKTALSATLVGTPVLHTVFATGLTGAITTTPFIPSGLHDMDGSLVIPPGGYAAIYTSTVSGAAALAGSFMWEEVPLIR